MHAMHHLHRLLYLYTRTRKCNSIILYSAGGGAWQLSLPLVLLLTRCAWVLVLARQDHRSPVDVRESLGGYWGAVRSNGGANGHEEAIVYLVSVCRMEFRS